jgi:hypothetical protein
VLQPGDDGAGRRCRGRGRPTAECCGSTCECVHGGRARAWCLMWPAGAGQVARACANQRRAGGLVWQGRPGWPGALQHLHRGGGHHDAYVPALSSARTVRPECGYSRRSTRGGRHRRRMRTLESQHWRRRGWRRSGGCTVHSDVNADSALVAGGGAAGGWIPFDRAKGTRLPALGPPPLEFC